MAFLPLVFLSQILNWTRKNRPTTKNMIMWYSPLFHIRNSSRHRNCRKKCKATPYIEKLPPHFCREWPRKTQCQRHTNESSFVVSLNFHKSKFRRSPLDEFYSCGCIVATTSSEVVQKSICSQPQMVPLIFSRIVVSSRFFSVQHVMVRSCQALCSCLVLRAKIIKTTLGQNSSITRTGKSSPTIPSTPTPLRRLSIFSSNRVQNHRFDRVFCLIGFPPEHEYIGQIFDLDTFEGMDFRLAFADTLHFWDRFSYPERIKVDQIATGHKKTAVICPTEIITKRQRWHSWLVQQDRFSGTSMGVSSMFYCRHSANRFSGESVMLRSCLWHFF